MFSLCSRVEANSLGGEGERKEGWKGGREMREGGGEGRRKSRRNSGYRRVKSYQSGVGYLNTPQYR